MVKELYSLQDRVLARISKFADKHIREILAFEKTNYTFEEVL